MAIKSDLNTIKRVSLEDIINELRKIDSEIYKITGNNVNMEDACLLSQAFHEQQSELFIPVYNSNLVFAKKWMRYIL